MDSPLDSLEQVTLQIGEKKFHTLIGTLTQRSDYSRAFFSGKFTVKKQDDGSIFIDADPVLFEYLLKYFRRGVFPLAFDKAKSHNYALYAELLEEARYFQCPALITLAGGRLLRKVHHLYSVWKISSKPNI